MTYVDFALVKKHVHADDFSDDDAVLTAYHEAAENIVSEYVDRIIFEDGGSAPSGDDGTAMEVTPAVTAAVLLLVGDMYLGRESNAWGADQATLPKTVRALLAPYRVWRVLSEADAEADPITT